MSIEASTGLFAVLTVYFIEYLPDAQWAVWTLCAVWGALAYSTLLSADTKGMIKVQNFFAAPAVVAGGVASFLLAQGAPTNIAVMYLTALFALFMQGNLAAFSLFGLRVLAMDRTVHAKIRRRLAAHAAFFVAWLLVSLLVVEVLHLAASGALP
ncbi:MAG: hypothetical protein WBB85_09850 [Albidovulum sp.]|uniref:hypothetical protein n=1 Tax=Albidovulum sp. TaxID=1872424 RepID=UPI003C8D5DFF